MNKGRINQLSSRAEGLRGEARTAVARVTTPIEAGMTNAMNRLGVPTRKEIATLTKRVEELTRVVAKSRTRRARPVARRRPRRPAPERAAMATARRGRRGRRLGLALAGGGPAGAVYEIGALRALEESIEAST